MIISFVTRENDIMKIAVLLAILVIGIMMPISAYAEAGEIGYKLLPEKILEYTDGTLQVFVESDGVMIPQQIIGLEAKSTDTEVIKIINIESANEYITNIKVQAQKPGEANIALAAPGFMSKEIPIKIYDNNNFPTQIKMKITPNEFPVDGPKFGYIGIELLTTSGQPTKAEQDRIIELSTPNTNMIELVEDQVVIKQGEYFAVTQFKIKSSGEPIIFAKTEGMKRISEFFKIHESSEPYRIQIYASPTEFTSYSSPIAFVVIQLQDNDGVPVVAEEDIHVSISSSNPNGDTNTSDDFEEVLFDEDKLVIKEGSYSAYTSFSPRPNVGDFTESDFQIYTISASTNDYISTSTQITVLHERIGGGETGQVKGGQLIGKGPAKFTSLPFLTTGEEELIGIAFLEDEVKVVEVLSYLDPNSSTEFATITDKVTLPIMASEDFQLELASSSLKTVSFQDPSFKQGSNAVLVFGNTGTMAPKDCSLEFYLKDVEGTSKIIGDPYGPVEDALTLNVEPVIPKILAGTSFPVLGYLVESDSSDSDDSGGDSCYSSSSSEDEDEESGRVGVTFFTDDTVLTFSANEYSEIEPTIIEQNQPYALMTAESLKVGKTTLDVRGSDLAATTNLESHTTDPTIFELSYAESTLPDTTTLSVIQVLDSAGNPVYTNKDIEITLVSNNESVLKVPKNIVIPKDEYRTFFEINTFAEGDSEIAILSEDLPLAKYDLNVKGIHPQLKLDITGSGLVGEVMMATLSVSYPGVSLTPEDMKVDWEVSGAEIMYAQPKTNAKGKANLELLSNTPSTASIKAVVNGIGVSNAETVASYSFAHPEGYVEIVESDKSGLGGIGLDDSQLIYFIVPGAAAGAFLFLKRTNRLEEITERLPIGDLGERFEGLKERISEIRERD